MTTTSQYWYVIDPDGLVLRVTSTRREAAQWCREHHRDGNRRARRTTLHEGNYQYTFTNDHVYNITNLEWITKDQHQQGALYPYPDEPHRPARRAM